MTSDDLKEAAARAKGLAPSKLIAKARPGAVFSVLDKAISFPTARLPTAGPRKEHVGRRAIVVQAQVRCASAIPITLLVVPCSASSHSVGIGDLVIPQGEGGFTEPSVIAYATLMQPVLKSDLLEHHGQLADETLLALQRAVLQTLGLTNLIELDLARA